MMVEKDNDKNKLTSKTKKKDTNKDASSKKKPEKKIKKNVLLIQKVKNGRIQNILFKTSRKR